MAYAKCRRPREMIMELFVNGRRFARGVGVLKNMFAKRTRCCFLTFLNPDMGVKGPRIRNELEIKVEIILQKVVPAHFGV